MRDRAGVPAARAVPAVVARVAGGRTARAVWVNEAGGLTFEVGEGLQRFFVKWARPERAWELEAEAKRLRWAAAFTPVPTVIDQGGDDTGAWLATTPLVGQNAVAPRWTAEPKVAVRAIGEGLRALHDALPLEACPLSWSAGARLADARRRGAANALKPSDWHPIHRHLNVEEALALAGDIPPTDMAVVCHGDACAPNTPGVLVDGAPLGFSALPSRPARRYRRHRRVRRRCWFGGRPPSCRAIAEHARMIDAANLAYPVTLAADGHLMDGGHRIAKAWLDGATHVDAVRFVETPEPDWIAARGDEAGRLVVVCGLPGSGKTTLGRRLELGREGSEALPLGDVGRADLREARSPGARKPQSLSLCRGARRATAVR